MAISAGASRSASTIAGVTAWLGTAAPSEPSGPWGIAAGEGFWDGADPPAGADLVYLSVPAGADPGAVMHRVRGLG